MPDLLPSAFARRFKSGQTRGAPGAEEDTSAALARLNSPSRARRAIHDDSGEP